MALLTSRIAKLRSLTLEWIPFNSLVNVLGSSTRASRMGGQRLRLSSKGAGKPLEGLTQKSSLMNLNMKTFLRLFCGKWNVSLRSAAVVHLTSLWAPILFGELPYHVGLGGRFSPLPPLQKLNRPETPSTSSEC